MATLSLKRPNEEPKDDSGDGREAKKLKTRFQDGGEAKPGNPEQMSSDQIKEMMLKAQQMIEERKRSLQQPPGLVTVPLVLSSMPPVQPPVPAVPLPATMDERSRKIAELQAKLQSKLATSTLASLNTLTLPKPPVALASSAVPEEPKPGPLILNAEGRTVDASGKEILLPQYTPTLKANIRAQKREVLKTHMSKGSQQKDEADSLTDSKFFDPRVATKSAVRNRRTFHFHDQGKFQQAASQMRMKAQLDRLQNEISQIARKTGINSVTALALVAPRIGDQKATEEVPELEWWDSVILQTRSYEGEDGQPNLRVETITNLIEHPIEMRAPTDPLVVPCLPVFLTKKEQKKLRRTTRRENWKEKQEKIRIGLEPPPQAKVRISNLMRVLGNEAIQDPTKIEIHVKEQMAKRLQTHQEANASRKLTAEQRREKTEKKLKEEVAPATGGVHVAVYRVKDLHNPAKKFKIETNCKQFFMTGCAVLFKDVNVVVVEGGPKQQKKYKRLMLNRIRWEEDTIKTKSDAAVAPVEATVNCCKLIWEGTTKQRNFGEFIFKLCPSEAVAREHFRKHGVEHYWDLSYSSAVLEETEEK